MEEKQQIIPPHGRYRKLLSYQANEIIYDLTCEFVRLYIDYKSRTRDQMEQAARSGKSRQLPDLSSSSDELPFGSATPKLGSGIFGKRWIYGKTVLRQKYVS